MRALACLLLVSGLSGCDTSDRRAQAALNDYQAAAAANDLPAARKALLQLVAAKDDVSDYWTELGKLDSSQGRLGDAAYAFNRAYELDRRNPELVRAVMQLALRSGDLQSARTHADELEVLAPNDPSIKLTRGWIAVGESEYDKAIAASDAVLTATPFDPSAAVLKGRALIGLNKSPEAAAFLEKQVAAVPSDVGSLRLLARLYARQEDWTDVMRVAQILRAAAPTDQDNLLMLAKAAFRAGNAPAGRQASLQLLQLKPAMPTVTELLDVWSQLWPSPQRVQDARSLAQQSANLPLRLTYARYLSNWGDSQDAMRLAAPAAGLPVDAGNAEANAVLAQALSRGGDLAQAKPRFDAVIAFDPGNATALSGRAELLLRAGNAPAAVLDAQKLVAAAPTDAAARLLLARTFAAAGQNDWASRTLWTAFQDIPANERIFAALLATKRGDSAGAQELKDEFSRQLEAGLNQGLA